MKRILAALILLLSISSLFAVNLDLTVTSGNFKLYDAYGHRCDAETVSDLEGLIVLTNDEEVTFSTIYGDITLDGGSIFSVLSLDASAPTFYLVNGGARFDLRENIYIQVYTPVTLTAVNTTGSYKILTTDDEEAIYNYSENGQALSLDALSGNSYEIEPMTYSSLTKMVVNVPLEDVEEVKEEEVIPAEPTITEPESTILVPERAEIVVTESTLTGIPSIPELYVSSEELNAPSAASLNVKEAVLLGVPSKADFVSVTYESNLIPPKVSVFEVEKKTLTE